MDGGSRLRVPKARYFESYDSPQVSKVVRSLGLDKLSLIGLVGLIYSDAPRMSTGPLNSNFPRHIGGNFHALPSRTLTRQFVCLACWVCCRWFSVSCQSFSQCWRYDLQPGSQPELREKPRNPVISMFEGLLFKSSKVGSGSGTANHPFEKRENGFKRMGRSSS